MEQWIQKQYELWREKVVTDADLVRELCQISNDPKRIEDAFYKNLEFGTGGLRGIIGAGTNRINIFTVAKASQGLAHYVINRFPVSHRKIAISYDSRIKSEVFAKVAASVFAANEIQVAIYSELMPTPCLSYAVRELECSAGIVITASHNPAKYNGYKVYGADGCQITSKAASEILSEIEKLDIFKDVQAMSFDTGIENGLIKYISDDVLTSYINAVKRQSQLDKDVLIDKNVSIVYSPLNGTGLKPVLRTLKEAGFSNITVVQEQEQPDGNFTTCPSPNPEVKEALAFGIKYAEKYGADLLLATDPDCDRVGIAVKNRDGAYVLLSGNEVGILLLDYICSRRLAVGRMPTDPVMIKTIVTMNLAEQIAAHYGVRTINVLTGFKFIGEQIGKLESYGKLDSYIFGFEESCGYLSGSYVRDKDAVNGVFLISEMFAYYKTRNISLLEKLANIYSAYGYCLNTLHAYKFYGPSGFRKMRQIMECFRNGIDSIGGKEVISCLDYQNGLDGLPTSDVLKFLLSDNCSFVIRPSGTEPKLKVYLSVGADSVELAKNIEKDIVSDIQDIIKNNN